MHQRHQAVKRSHDFALWCGASSEPIERRASLLPMAGNDRQNMIAVTLVVIIALAATLLFSNFVRSVAMMKCASSGRQDCVERVVTSP